MSTSGLEDALFVTDFVQKIEIKNFVLDCCKPEAKVLIVDSFFGVIIGEGMSGCFGAEFPGLASKKDYQYVKDCFVDVAGEKPASVFNQAIELLAPEFWNLSFDERREYLAEKSNDATWRATFESCAYRLHLMEGDILKKTVEYIKENFSG